MTVLAWHSQAQVSAGSVALQWTDPRYIDPENPLKFSIASSLGTYVPSIINGTTAKAT